MHITQWLLVALLIIPLAFVMRGRLRMELAALLMAACLGILQFAGLSMLGPAHTPQDAAKILTGFSQPVVISLIALFILTRGLEKSGVTRWIAEQVLRLGGNRPQTLIGLFAAITALLSLFMNNLAAGALALPSAMEASRRTGIRPSKLLIPVAYGSLLGGMATYFTTANIIMSDLLRIADPPQAPLHILDFTPVGGLIMLAGILFLWLFGSRLLPEHRASSEQAIVRHTGSELEDLYQIGKRLWRARVQRTSDMVGRYLHETNLGRTWGVTAVAIQHGPSGQTNADLNQQIQAGDQLLLIGREEKVLPLKASGLDISAMDQQDHLSTRGISLAEVILAPHSALEGKTLKDVKFRQQYGLTVIAIKRRTRSYRTEVGTIPLEMGDSLLVMSPTAEIQQLRQNPEVIVIEPNPGDQPVNLRQAALTIGLTLAAIGASIAGMPVYLAMLSGAALVLLFGVLTMEEAYQAIEWQAIFLVAGMYAVSLATVQTGLADLIGTTLLALTTPFGALGLAGAAFLLSALLTQFLGGQVTALVTGPLALTAALSIGANPQAVAVATAIGCSAAFLTPMAHPLNTLVMAPANYKFRDFIRAGWLLTLLSFVMLLVGMRLFWGL